MAFIDDLRKTPLTPAESNLNNGFSVPATKSADGNGLPYTKVTNRVNAIQKRNIIHWFIPEFGLVKMYINPQSISYSDSKQIHQDRTKGGYTLQYWGEELTTISIVGTTGSSGIEGINVLHEIYRAEQYAFDSTGLTLAASNITNIVSNALNDTGPFGTLVNGLTGNSTTNLSGQNITSLAQLAFGVEMYYSGWVYRGYFKNITINEKANDFNIDYNISFIATQKRGYRTNTFPFQKSANSGPSGSEVPNSFSGYIE